jgi:predicted alpha/beta-fold hydrolase
MASEEKDPESSTSPDPEEDEDAYRLRVYGTTDYQQDLRQRRSSLEKEGSVRRLSRRVSRQISRSSSMVQEQLPETPTGWIALLTSLGCAALGYEINVQRKLTKPPIVFGQLEPGGVLESVYQKMSATGDKILSRNIRPSLFVGTRGQVASTAAYLLRGPSSQDGFVRFREIMTMTQDGATIGVDWEAPIQSKESPSVKSDEQRKTNILKGPIREPVVIILHGINNDASFGYMQSLQRTFAKRGWNSAAMNFRGVGGVPMTTPRGYNAAYTGDIRCLVHRISARLDKDVPVFLIGNSLGANILTKYLGEEGLSGTLPDCVAGAASLGNPLQIHSANIPFPISIVMGMGVKRTVISNLKTILKTNDREFRNFLTKGMKRLRIGDYDKEVAPILIKNDEFYPFSPRIGYKSGEEYWHSSSSYRFVRHISVPLLNLTASDDFLVTRPSRSRIGYCIANPNVMVVETRCGGHLGWQESSPDGGLLDFGASSWADVAAADFFESIMKTNVERYGKRTVMIPDNALDLSNENFPSEMMQRNALKELASLRSRL